MTNKCQRFARTGLLACLLGAGLCTTALAQNFPPPALLQKNLAPTPLGMGTINSAMMECPNLGGQTFAAVTVSDFNRTNLYLNFGNGTVTSGPIPVTGTPWALADVTIGDDMSAPGDRYIVAVSYREIVSYTPLIYDIMVRTYVVDDPGGAMNITANAPIPVGTGNNPKIDIIADQGNMIGPYPAMHQVLIAYTDPSSTIQLNVRNMDLTNVTNYAIPYAAPGGFYNAIDAAAVIDRNSGDLIACVSAISNGNSDLEVYESNLSILNTPPPTLLQTNLASYYTRIEAFGIYDAASGAAKWAATTSDDLRKIRLYTDLTPGYTANPQPYFDGSSHEYPALASGIGPVAGPQDNIGNSQYTYARGAPQFKNYYAQFLDLAGNPVNPNDFPVVNNTPCTMVSDPPELITLCNSSNSGADLFIAWNEGTSVMYKQTGNTFGFRPTGTGTVNSFATLTVSPNPAQDRIIIRTTQDVNYLSMMNSIGALVHRQSMKSGETTVDISGFAAGTYFLHISGKDGNTTRPLVITR